MESFNYGQDFDIEEFLEQSREQERRCLERELQEIDEQLEQRRQLHRETVEELESKLEWYIDRLETLYQRSMGKHGDRQRLRDRIEQFYQERREEERSLWRDRQELERERRELLRDLEELLDTSIIDLL